MKLSLHHSVSSRKNQDTVIRRMFNDPYVDWAMILIIFIALVGVLGGVGFLTYVGTQDELVAASQVDTTKPAELFGVDDFKKVLKEFDARATERVNIIKGYSGVGDPVL